MVAASDETPSGKTNGNVPAARPESLLGSIWLPESTCVAELLLPATRGRPLAGAYDTRSAAFGDLASASKPFPAGVEVGRGVATVVARHASPLHGAGERVVEALGVATLVTVAVGAAVFKGVAKGVIVLVGVATGEGVLVWVGALDGLVLPGDGLDEAIHASKERADTRLSRLASDFPEGGKGNPGFQRPLW